MSGIISNIALVAPFFNSSGKGFHDVLSTISNAKVNKRNMHTQMSKYHTSK